MTNPRPIQHSFIRIRHTHPIKQASKHDRSHKRFPSQALPMFHVKHQPPTTNREETTLSNNQPANRPTPQYFTWNTTTRSIYSPLQLRQLMFHVKPKLETKKLIQRPQSWLVSVSKERQAR